MAEHHHFSFIWQYTGKTIIRPVEKNEIVSTENNLTLLSNKKVQLKDNK
jgi:hypothetical protein